ncbi:MAG: Mur ligase family protein [Candidatus Methanomethylicaceae archaeon]
MKILVIDATHGGLILSEAFSKQGHEVTCIDIYKTIHNKHFQKFTIERNLPSDLSKYDLIVKPVHFPSHFFKNFEGKIITHHEAVKILVHNKIDFPIVEITGSFGKTTAIKCAISLLRNFSILTLTSDGIIFMDKGHEKILLKNISTTPANIIRALELCPKKPDFAIFEVSLGGTGMADLGIIKNVYDNYPIAKGTSSAFIAKISMINNRKPNSTILLNADDPLLRGFSNVQYFSTSSNSSEVWAEDIHINLGHINFIVIFKGFMTRKGPTYSKIYVEANEKPIGRQHVENILVGISIAKFFEEIEEKVEIPPEVFDKKMILEDYSGPLILNKSPAINSKVLATSIKDFMEILPPIRLEIGGKLKTTCGFIEPLEIAQIINSSQFKEVHLFDELGEVLRPLINKELKNSIEKVPTLRLERE